VHDLRAGARCACSIVCSSLRLDWRIGCLCAVYLLLFLPTITRHTENPQLVAAFSNDEPFLVMALDATTRFPWGNPGNYFDVRKSAQQSIPDYWGGLRYEGINYYGGALYVLASPIYAVLRVVGFPPFPTAPILLRLLVVLAGLASLVVLYNIGKSRGMAWAGLIAAAYLGTDTFFLYYSTTIHPDTIQLALGLVAFVAAARHVRDGERGSLVALGLFCGFVQASKVGGPWLAPAALIALTLGIHDGLEWRKWTSRAVLFLGGALFGWFIAAPYTFLDPYFMRTLLPTLRMVSATPFDAATLPVWIRTLTEHLGQWACALAAVTLLRAAWAARAPRRDPELVLAAVIALSQILWFGNLSKVWTQIGYLLVAIGLGAVFALETIGLAARRITPAVLASRAILLAVPAFVGALIFLPRVYPMIDHLLGLQLWRSSTMVALNHWASEGGIPPSSRIVFDDLAYFDPKIFPSTRMHGGVLTWRAVNTYDPDYIVLSGSLYNAPWYVQLRAMQKLDRQDPDPFSMRLYQDLLVRDDPGHVMPGIDLIKVIRPTPNVSDAGWTPAVEDILQNQLHVAPTIANPILVILQKAAMILHPGHEPRIGPEQRVFRLDSARATARRIGPFATGTQAGYDAFYAFDGTNAAWACDGVGASTGKCHVGYDFGDGDARRLAIRFDTKCYSGRVFGR
jgi:Dolichyl-phosphate-mannose-protein mannosyltransferase